MKELNGRDLAKARDEWLESEEGKGCLEGTTSGQYLSNRLQRAFIAGVKAAERLMREQSKPKAKVAP